LCLKAIENAVYSGVDYFVYQQLAEFGAAGAIETLGVSAATATGAGYYNMGGAKGIARFLFCPL
jgi:hypothetical protein